MATAAAAVWMGISQCWNSVVAFAGISTADNAPEEGFGADTVSRSLYQRNRPL